MEAPLGMVTEMGSGSVVTEVGQLEVEGKKWPVVPVSATTGSVVGGSSEVEQTVFVSLGGND